MPTMPPEATRRIGTTVTVSGALTAGQHTPADATTGNVTLTLPVSPRYGASLSVEKADASPNTVIVSGSIRGSAGTLSLGYQFETIEFRADAGGTWRPIVNHLPKSAVDAKVAALATSVAATYSPLLPTTGIKTAAYSTPGTEIIPVDATAGAVPITLPNAPANNTRVTIKKIDSSSNAVTIATAGSDVLNKAGGSATATLTLLNQASTVQYVRSSGVWLVVASDVPLSQLDGRYATLAQQLLGWGYGQSYRVVSATRDANEAITTASVVWPDGATGTFTTDTASTTFPGAIDAYHVTHVLAGTTLTVTQPAVTRDAGGAVTAQPALTVA